MKKVNLLMDGLNNKFTDITLTKGKSHIMLTQRENEVLTLSAMGLAIKQISDRLSISGRTVEKHRSNIMEKTNTNSIIEAIYFLQQRDSLYQNEKIRLTLPQASL
jgi:DNA-binding NarL/FixJ family response regulator